METMYYKTVKCSDGLPDKPRTKYFTNKGHRWWFNANEGWENKDIEWWLSPLPAKDAKEFLKEKGIEIDYISIPDGKNWRSINLCELLTEFASFRPQETVEIERDIRNLGDKTMIGRIDYECPACHKGMLFYKDEKDFDKFCPNCGVKITWK